MVKPLSRYQRAVLHTLSMLPRPTVARHLGGHPSSLTFALRHLEELGLAARDLHEQWRITEKGRTQLLVQEAPITECAGTKVNDSTQ